MKKIKWGIISTAKIAETDLIPAIKKSNNSELVAVASRNKLKAAKFAKKLPRRARKASTRNLKLTPVKS